MQVKNEN